MRQPCPGRIYEDLGIGFSIGCFGGTLVYFVKGKCNTCVFIQTHQLSFTVGFYNAPRRKKFMGGITHVRNRAPLIGGSFAMWGGCFSSVDCLMIHKRQKDDPWNAIVAGFITGGLL